MKIFELVANNTECQQVLGGSIVRFYPVVGVQNHEIPYATYQDVAGYPLDHITCPAMTDSMTYQVDVYAKTYKEVQDIGDKIRKAIERDCFISSFRGVIQETETELYRLSFDCDWLINR